MQAGGAAGALEGHGAGQEEEEPKAQGGRGPQGGSVGEGAAFLSPALQLPELRDHSQTPLGVQIPARIQG